MNERMIAEANLFIMKLNLERNSGSFFLECLHWKWFISCESVTLFWCFPVQPLTDSNPQQLRACGKAEMILLSL